MTASYMPTFERLMAGERVTIKDQQTLYWCVRRLQCLHHSVEFHLRVDVNGVCFERIAISIPNTGAQV